MAAGKAIRNALTVLGLLVAVVTATPFTTWWAQRMAATAGTMEGETLIVLGGSTVDGQYLGESSYWRCVFAVLAWRHGRFQNVVISGRDAAPLMRDFLAGQGVPLDRIRLEIESGNTWENARRTAALLAGSPGRKVLLTSDSHMPRALGAFRKAGLGVQPLPAPDAGKRSSRWQGRWPAFLDLCAESAAWAWYRIRGWV
jgi:uncharacterized SAM-binding protein YcdF (DUF218 family)